MKKCKFCGEEIKKKATKCRFCGEWLKEVGVTSEQKIEAPIQEKKSAKKASAFFVMFIFIGIVIIGYNLESAKPGDKKINANTAEKSKPVETTYKMKQEVQVGYFTYAVENMIEEDKVGTSFYLKKASGIYKIILIAAANNDKESRYLDSTMFKIKDDKGRAFDVSTEANTAWNMQLASTNKEITSTDLFLKQLNPSLAVVGFLIFDIPKDATGLKLEVSGGIVSSEKKYIELQ